MVKVAFLHPDLGIGGGERAVIDAALALKSRGHSVHFVTAHHNPDLCFEETRDGTVPVTTAGDWLPRNILGRCQAACAYIRMIYAALYLVFFSGLEFDMVFCDQISACIPVLRLSKAKILFYCHFPDLLLTQSGGFMKSLYRVPINWLEEKTTGMADCVLVNSKFTASVFEETFQSLQKINPDVLYPIPGFSSFQQPVDPPADDLMPKNTETTFLSINRYERKKNLALAIGALGHLKKNGEDLTAVHLIMAGGYDERLQENREYYLELRRLCEKLQLQDKVTFLRSFSGAQKRTLLHHSQCLIYTPDKEHFGIVPVEAMYMKCPVIAVKSGGPMETVADGETGFLCQPDKEDFAKAMLQFIKDPQLSKKLGEAGRKRVEEKFSFDTFTEKLDGIVRNLCEQ